MLIHGSSGGKDEHSMVAPGGNDSVGTGSSSDGLGTRATDSVASMQQAAPKAPDGTAVHFPGDDAEKVSGGSVEKLAALTS